MDVPDRWRSFPCGDYFGSPLAATGGWDADAQIWYIEPAERVFEDPAREFLIIGRPGVDGIEWGYRKGHPGLWAHYAVEKHFEPVAASAEELQEGWLSGRILV